MSSGAGAAPAVSREECGEVMTEGDRRIETVVVAPAEAGERLDRVLAARLADYSRSRLKSLILGGHVAIGERTVRDPGQRVNANERVHVTVPPPEPPEPQPEPMALDVVFEDDELLIIDKPAGLVVHPAAGHWSGTLVNALVAHCGDSLSGIGGVARPGIVHRLDKDTTGLMVVAKTDRAHRSLSRQFADHGRTGPLERGYLAFVWGVPDRPRGTVDKPIGRHPQSRDKMAIRADGREAVTHWELVEKYRGRSGEPVAALLACRLETGRTHQIRVHLASIGHPLIGDPVYGPGFRTKAALLPAEAQTLLDGLGRQALHAYLLGVQHPTSKKHLVYRAPLPSDLAHLHKVLGGGTIDLARR